MKSEDKKPPQVDTYYSIGYIIDRLHLSGTKLTEPDFVIKSR